jgi:hypothetical protein
MSSNFCVSCGAEIPDGSLVCYGCTKDRSDKALDMVKEIFTIYGDLIDVPEINSESGLDTMSKRDAVGMLRDILNWSEWLEERIPPRFYF